MGDPRKIKPKFRGPGHPWQKERIDQEKALRKEYGLKNKTEIWKSASKLKSFATHAKRLVALSGEQAQKEKKQLLQKLYRMGLLPQEAVLEDILALEVKDILERRLQTLVCRKGFAHTLKQSRQFITHGHILIAGKKITAPSYLVLSEEEPTMEFIKTSALADAEHPERKIEKKPAAPAKAEAPNRNQKRQRKMQRPPRKEMKKNA